MKNLKITSVLLSALLLASCSDATVSTNNEVSGKESESATVETTEATSEETTTEETTAEETTAEETTAEETTGSVSGESVVYEMKHADLDENGNIPDGKYYTYDYTINSDLKDGVFDVEAYYYLDAADVAKLKVGDKLLLNDYIDIDMIEDNKDKDNHMIDIAEFSWYLNEQASGVYYLDDFTGFTFTGSIAKDRKIEFAPDVIIYDGANVYSTSGIKITDATIKYDSVADFYADLKSDKAYNDPAIQLVIKDGVITEMYINPALHEPWIER